MNKRIDCLNKAIYEYRDALLALKEEDDDNLESYLYNLLDATYYLYEEDVENVYIPFVDGKIKMHKENDCLYYPIYSEKELIKDPNVEIRKVKFRKYCDIIFENSNIYSLYKQPEKISEKGCIYSRKEVDDYVSKYVEVTGIIYDSYTDREFLLKDYLIDTVVAKAIELNEEK